MNELPAVVKIEKVWNVYNELEKFGVEIDDRIK